MNINIKKIIIVLITLCTIFLYYYIFNQSYLLIKYPYDNGLYNLDYYLSMISFSIGLGCLLFGIFLLIKNIRLKKKLFSKTIIVLLIIPILSYFFISSFLGGLIIEGEDWNKQLVGSDKEEHGCIGSAGYTWCEVKNKCLRTWEEECIEEEENNKKMTDEEAKQYFHATEIVNNNLPESIEFWTEAYCPGSGTDYDYNVDNISVYYYSFDSCEQGETGSHGGCKNCIMSRIKIKKPNYLDTCEGSGFYYKNINELSSEKALFQFYYIYDGHDCRQCIIDIFNKTMHQKIEEKQECFGFELYDVNFDNYKDLLITKSTSVNSDYSVYLFDLNKKEYIQNENYSIISFNRVTYFKENKEIYENRYYGVGNCELNIYKIENNNPILIKREKTESCIGI